MFLCILVRYLLNLESQVDLEISSKNKVIFITRDQKGENEKTNEVAAAVEGETSSSSSSRAYQFSQNFQIKNNLISPVRGIQVQVVINIYYLLRQIFLC